MKTTSSNKLTLKAKWGYSFGEYFYTYTVMLFLTFFVFFLTDTVGINPALAGTIYMIGMIWDAITDPTLGLVADNYSWKSGRRRTPFMKLAIIPTCILTVLMFINVDFSQTGKIIYYTLAVVGYYTFATTFYISYQALGAEMTSDLDERGSLMAIRAGILGLSSAIATAGHLYFLDFFTAKFNSEATGWIISIVLLCLVALILGIICIITTKPYERIVHNKHSGAKKKRVNFFMELGSVFKNKPFLHVALVTFACCLAAYGSIAMLMYYFTYYAGMTAAETSIAFLITGASGMATLSLGSYVMKKFERRDSYLLLMGGFLLTFIVLYLLGPGNKIGTYLAMILWGYGWMCLWTVVYTLIADVTVVDEYLTGKQREGTYYGIVQLFLKAGSGVIIWISGIILEKGGYVANVAQGESSLRAIKLVNAGIPILVLVISMVIMYFYPLNRKTYDAIVKAIELRKQGDSSIEIHGLTVGSGRINVVTTNSKTNIS